MLKFRFIVLGVVLGFAVVPPALTAQETSDPVPASFDKRLLDLEAHYAGLARHHTQLGHDIRVGRISLQQFARDYDPTSETLALQRQIRALQKALEDLIARQQQLEAARAANANPPQP